MRKLKTTNSSRVFDVSFGVIVLLSLALLGNGLFTFYTFKDKEKQISRVLYQTHLVRQTSADLTLLFFYEAMIDQGSMEGDGQAVELLAQQIKDVRDGHQPWPQDYPMFLASLINGKTVHYRPEQQSLVDMLNHNPLLSPQANDHLQQALLLSNLLYQHELHFDRIDLRSADQTQAFFQRYFEIKAQIIEQAGLGRLAATTHIKERWRDIMKMEMIKLVIYLFSLGLSLSCLYLYYRHINRAMHADLHQLTTTIDRFDAGESLNQHDHTLRFAQLDLLNQRLIAVMQQNQELTQRNERLAFTDSLTQLNNRHALKEKLFCYTPYKEDGITDVIVVVDLDNFKQLNDNHGHGFGDEVLTRVAEILRETIRERDFAVRMGGEEFVLFCQKFKVANVEEFSQRLLQAISDHRFVCDDVEVAVTISMGITDIATDEQFDDALQRADGLLYQAKRQGRNQAVHQWTDSLLAHLFSVENNKKQGV